MSMLLKSMREKNLFIDDLAQALHEQTGPPVPSKKDQAIAYMQPLVDSITAHLQSIQPPQVKAQQLHQIHQLQAQLAKQTEKLRTHGIPSTPEKQHRRHSKTSRASAPSAPSHSAPPPQPPTPPSPDYLPETPSPSPELNPLPPAPAAPAETPSMPAQKATTKPAPRKRRPRHVGPPAPNPAPSPSPSPSTRPEATDGPAPPPLQQHCSLFTHNTQNWPQFSNPQNPWLQPHSPLHTVPPRSKSGLPNTTVRNSLSMSARSPPFSPRSPSETSPTLQKQQSASAYQWQEPPRWPTRHSHNSVRRPVIWQLD